MSKAAIKVIGIILIVFGIIGIGGWAYSLSIANSELGNISDALRGIDGLGLGIGGEIAQTVDNISLLVTAFFGYNIMVNLMLILTGISLFLITRSLPG